MRASRLTMDNIKELYPTDKFIHIVPSVSKHMMGPNMFGIDVATVKIDPNDEKLVYPLKTEWRNNQSRVLTVGLSAVSINRIAGMADVNVTIKHLAYSPDLVVAVAHAEMSSPAGGVRTRESTVSWEQNLERDVVLMNAEDYVERGIKQKWTGYVEANRQDLIDRKFRKDWIQERKFGPRKAESKAARNSVKNILGISEEYDPDELALKEFCVVKFVFAPDMSDPDVKRLVIESGLMAQGQLYGRRIAAQTGTQFVPMQTYPALPESTDRVEEEQPEVDEPAVEEPMLEEPDEEFLLMVKVIARRIETAKETDIPTGTIDRWTARLDDASVDLDKGAMRKLGLEIKAALKKADTA